MDPKIFKQQLLNELYKPYEKCIQCPLGFLGRTQVVFGEGNPDAELMLIGEAPGRDEDIQGKPFVGRSGQLLNRALHMVGIERSEVFITNIVKCRPPNNRVPTPVEVMTCTQLLLINQIKIVRPKIICTLGSVALHFMVNPTLKISQVRGSIIEHNDLVIIPIYHPAYILRNQTQAQIWLKDINFVKEKLKDLNRI